MPRGSTQEGARASFFIRNKNFFERPGVRGGFHLIGLIIIFVGIALIMLGVSERNAAQDIDTEKTEQNGLLEPRKTTDLDKEREKNDKEMTGFMMMGIGGMLLFFGIAVNIFPYMPRFYASYYGPVIHEFGDAIGEGLSKARSSEQSETKSKEIIKIKCRKCGYLETEDADFCSKCGKKL